MLRFADKKQPPTEIYGAFPVLLERSDDIVTTAITTVIVRVVAAISPADAWHQPLLRLVDTVVGVGVAMGGLASLFQICRKTGSIMDNARPPYARALRARRAARTSVPSGGFEAGRRISPPCAAEGPGTIEPQDPGANRPDDGVTGLAEEPSQTL